MPCMNDSGKGINHLKSTQLGTTMRVTVLMSSYNGEKYISEQLQSILSQLPREGQILIRDDGSTDATLSIVRSLSESRIKVIEGSNIGFARSFLALMSAAPVDSEMYMLADQDDVWLPGKIQSAWMYLKDHQTGIALYCSRAQLTDQKLHPIGMTPLFEPASCLTHALTENIATGCTIAVTPNLLGICASSIHQELIGFHDWWLYVVAQSLGTVHFDPHPKILYRQHQNNSIGMGSGIARYFNILRYLRRHNWLKTMNNQIMALRINLGSRLSKQQHLEISRLQSANGKLRRVAILTNPHRLRISLFSDLLFRLLVTLDWRDVSSTRPSLQRDRTE
jgi:glycosyltransferase involved in cell wall biosynthesis